MEPATSDAWISVFLDVMKLPVAPPEVREIAGHLKRSTDERKGGEEAEKKDCMRKEKLIQHKATRRVYTGLGRASGDDQRPLSLFPLMHPLSMHRTMTARNGRSAPFGS
jgi:hypothetical protein